MRNNLKLAIALLAALALAVLATTPPEPRPASAPPGEFSAARAMADVRIVATRPHPTGSAENAKVRGYLIERLRGLGFAVSTVEAPIGEHARKVLREWSGAGEPPATLVNLIGVLPGSDRSLPAVLLMSHYDSVWGSPGAADDTAGVAATLEVVRAIQAAGQPKRDLIVLITDGEEIGLEGAEHFFAADPLRQRVGAIVNMEARGGGGRTTLFQLSRDNGEAAALYARSVERPAASSLAAYVYSVLPNDTDLTPALAGPYTAYNFAFIGRPGLYHSPLATPANLDQGSLQDMGAQVLDLSRALLAAEALPGKTPDGVFFDLFGLTTVTFPAGAGWAMLVLAGLALGFAARGASWGSAASAALRSLGVLAFAAALLHLLNLVSMGAEKTNYYDRLAAIPQLELMALYATIAAVLAAFAGWRGQATSALGAGLPLVVLAGVVQWIAPTAAYILVVPALLVALNMAFASWRPGNAARWIAVAVAALVTGYMLGLEHQLMQGVGPTMAWIAALPLLIAVTALAPLFPAFPPRRALIAAVVFACAGLAVALWVRHDPLAASVAVYSVDKDVAPIPITKPA
jgi:hypothetical protein